MSNNKSIEKRRGGSVLLIIFLIVGLSLLFFSLISKQFGISLTKRSSSDIEKGISPGVNHETVAQAPAINPRSVTLLYVLTDNKVSSAFLQVINAYEKNIYYLEIPLNSKLSISADLYKELLSYAPTLPQYVKLSRAGGYFSENFRYDGCTKILSENIGVKVTDWCIMTAEDFEEFKRKSTGDNYSKDDYLTIFEKYANNYRSSMSSKERWAYYEIFDKAAIIEKGSIPGQWDKTDFYISAVQAREITEELKY